MKYHTTNYINTFIEVADDCPISESQIPPEKKEKSLSNLQYEFLVKNPYKYTSDDLIFKCYITKNDISESEKNNERNKFFSKGQPCLRCSALAKRYGFGFHHNEKSKVAIILVESEEYRKLIQNNFVKKVKAMRSKRK
jgi:hypothetical protein